MHGAVQKTEINGDKGQTPCSVGLRRFCRAVGCGGFFQGFAACHCPCSCAWSCPGDGREKRQHREIQIPLYGSSQENGDLSWRLTGLLLSVCFSCHGIQPCELHRSAQGEEIKLFKSPFGFGRDRGNSPGDEVYFSPLVPGFEEFLFFPLLKAGLSEKPLLEETLVCAHTT